MSETKIIGTGLNGLVGSRIVELLQKKYSFENISRSTGVEITKKDQVINAIKSSNASIVLHLTAKTDVDGCEKDKNEDLKLLNNLDLNNFTNDDIENTTNLFSNLQTAWALNVLGTLNVIKACQNTNKKIIYISTDFVFDGINPPEGGYTEVDKPNPQNWYSYTKYIGEELVRNSGLQYLIVRIAYPYGFPFEKKKDFVQAILTRLKEGKNVAGINDHIFVPTFIDDIALSLDVLISHNSSGIYHVVGSQALSPFAAAKAISHAFALNDALITETTRNEFFAGRAIRPYNLQLKSAKIERLGIKLKGFEEGLETLKKGK